MIRSSTALKAVLPFGAALALAACGGTEEERTYEADVTDLSGGDLIVSEEDPNAVPVTTPDVAMTPVPVEEAADDAAAPATDVPAE